MPIKVGDKIPSVFLKRLTDAGLEDIRTDDVLGKGKTVLFAVPGAFTPTCTAKHLPGFLTHGDDFAAKGYTTIACLAVNDPFVMRAWAKHNHAEGHVALLPDGNGVFTHALGLEMDGSAYGLGTRAQRFGMLIEDGVVKHLAVEAPGQFEVSSAEALLKVA